MLIYLLQGLGLGGAAAAQPGPFQAYLLSQTLKNGWRRTIWAAFAPLISDGPIVALVLFVLTKMPDWFLNLLQIGGGLFLIYLAYGAFVTMEKVTAPTSSRGQAVSPTLTSPTQSTILQAALMNALSPNPYIFWATVAGPVLIEGWRQSPLLGISFVVGFYGTLIGGFMAFVAFFALAGKIDDRLNRILSGFSAVVLLLFGLYQLWLGVSTFLIG